MESNPVVRLWNWLRRIDEVVGRWQIVAWIVGGVALITGASMQEATLITVGAASLVVGLLLLFSGESRKKARSAMEVQGRDDARQAPSNASPGALADASPQKESQSQDLDRAPVERAPTMRTARRGWRASASPLRANDPYAPGISLDLDGSSSAEAFSLFGCEVRGPQATYAYVPGDFLPNLELRQQEAIRFPGEFHPKPGWPPPPGSYIATWTAEDSQVMEITGPLHLAGVAFEFNDSGDLLTRSPVDDPARAALEITCDSGSEFHAQDSSRLGADEEAQHLARFKEKGLNVPKGAVWTRYTHLIKVTNVSGAEAKRVRVVLVEIEPRPRQVALPRRLRWNGMSSDEMDLHPGLSAYVELYSRFGLSGYWLLKSEYDWGDTATVTVEAWCEGTEPTRARFSFGGLQGPYIFPSALPLHIRRDKGEATR